MICRLWRGWTTVDNASAYERVVRDQVITAIEARRLPGFRRIDLMRRPLDDGSTEFATVMWFDDLTAVTAFAGEDYEASHVPAPARAVLAWFDERAAHFEVLDQRFQPLDTRLTELSEPLSPTTGLVVIDVQAGFDDPRWGLRNNPQAEENIARLLQAWRTSGRPVFHVRHTWTAPDGSFRAGSAGHAFKTKASPLKAEPIYTKQVNSAFIGTELERDLRRRGIGTLVIVGLTTNHCVSTTARMAANLGFDTLVVADATATFAQRLPNGQVRPAEELHVSALCDLHGEFAAVTDTSEVLRVAASVIDEHVPSSGQV